MQAKTKEMQESMKLLDVEMKRSDELLSQMIPKSVSDKIKAGANAVDTCEVFDMVTMVFNDIPAFLDICAKCDGLKVILFATPNWMPVNMTKYVVLLKNGGMDDGWIKGRYTMDKAQITCRFIHWISIPYLYVI